MLIIFVFYDALFDLQAYRTMITILIRIWAMFLYWLKKFCNFWIKKKTTEYSSLFFILLTHRYSWIIWPFVCVCSFFFSFTEEFHQLLTEFGTSCLLICMLAYIFLMVSILLKHRLQLQSIHRQQTYMQHTFWQQSSRSEM